MSKSSSMLFTKRLILERFRKEDFKFFLEIVNDPLIEHYFQRYRMLFQREDVRRYFEEEIVDKQNAYDLELVIRKKDETPIGFLNLYFLASGTWLVEGGILEPYRNQGYMTEVMNYLVTNSLEFSMAFRSNSVMKELVFCISNDNWKSSHIIDSISREQKLPLEISVVPFQDCFEEKLGECWYKLYF